VADRCSSNANITKPKIYYIFFFKRHINTIIIIMKNWGQIDCWHARTGLHWRGKQYGCLKHHFKKVSVIDVTLNPIHGEMHSYTVWKRVCQWLVADRCFSTNTPVFLSSKTDRYHITETFLKWCFKHPYCFPRQCSPVRACQQSIWSYISHIVNRTSHHSSNNHTIELTTVISLKYR
jgi:hypothetical protein